MSQPVILFDGVCNFCNSSVNFVIRQDKKKKFRFAPLQAEAGQAILRQYNLPAEVFNSFVLVDGGKVYQQSAAALKVLQQLPWYWQWTQAFWLVPKSLRDGVYNFVARHRYKWFGEKDQCMIPTPDVRSRFL